MSQLQYLKAVIQHVDASLFKTTVIHSLFTGKDIAPQLYVPPPKNDPEAASRARNPDLAAIEKTSPLAITWRVYELSRPVMDLNIDMNRVLGQRTPNESKSKKEAREATERRERQILLGVVDRSLTSRREVVAPGRGEGRVGGQGNYLKYVVVDKVKYEVESEPYVSGAPFKQRSNI
jgi:hypothetical protein